MAHDIDFHVQILKNGKWTDHRIQESRSNNCTWPSEFTVTSKRKDHRCPLVGDYPEFAMHDGFPPDFSSTELGKIKHLSPQTKGWLYFNDLLLTTWESSYRLVTGLTKAKHALSYGHGLTRKQKGGSPTDTAIDHTQGPLRATLSSLQPESSVCVTWVASLSVMIGTEVYRDLSNLAPIALKHRIRILLISWT